MRIYTEVSKNVFKDLSSDALRGTETKKDPATACTLRPAAWTSFVRRTTSCAYSLTKSYCAWNDDDVVYIVVYVWVHLSMGYNRHLVISASAGNLLTRE